MKITLKAARVNANLTQEEAAEALNISRATLLSWEKGKTKPRYDKLEQMYQLYHVAADNIFLP